MNNNWNLYRFLWLNVPNFNNALFINTYNIWGIYYKSTLYNLYAVAIQFPHKGSLLKKLKSTWSAVRPDTRYSCGLKSHSWLNWLRNHKSKPYRALLSVIDLGLLAPQPLFFRWDPTVLSPRPKKKKQSVSAPPTQLFGWSFFYVYWKGCLKVWFKTHLKKGSVFHSKYRKNSSEKSITKLKKLHHSLQDNSSLV